MQLNASTLSEALETLSPLLVLQKMKEAYFSQLDDYNEPFCEQQYKHGSCLFVCLLKFKSFDQLNPPRTASNFRHLLSCGTMVSSKSLSILKFQTFSGRE